MTDFKKLYDEWWFTIEGAGGDLNEWKTGLQDMLDEQGIGKIKEWATFKGRDMNEAFGLTGGNAYPDDLTFLAFSIDGLDQGKLAMFKLRFGARWFTDIVDNNARRESNPIYPWDHSGGPEEETQVYSSQKPVKAARGGKFRLIWDECNPTRDRRPTEAADIDNDIHVDDFSSKEDLLATLLELAGYDEEDLEDLDFSEQIQECLDTLGDPGDGSPNVFYCKLDDDVVVDGLEDYCGAPLNGATCTEKQVKKAMKAD